MAQLGAPVPVLRVLDGQVGREFYERLGFELLWEHRFEPDMPLYQRLRRDEMTLDLSEHHGDGIPGTVLWVPVRDVRALHAELRPRLWAHQRPGLEEDAPGGPTFSVGDPYGNHLRFCQPTAVQLARNCMIVAGRGGGGRMGLRTVGGAGRGTSPR